MKKFLNKKIAGFAYYEIGLCLLIPLLLIIIGSPLDYQITSSIASIGNPYGLVIAVIGGLPFYAIIGLSGILFFISLKDTANKYWGLFLAIVFSIGAGAVYGYETINDYISSLPIATIVGILVVLAIDFGLYFLVRKADVKVARRDAWIFLLSCAIIFCVVFVLKKLISRPRYALLLAEPIDGDYSYYYCSWWDILRGSRIKDIFTNKYPSSYFESAPSGHSAFATTAAVCVCFFPELNSKLAKKPCWFHIGGSLFVLLVILGRLSDGSHFLSDVGFACLIAYLISFVMVIAVTKKSQPLKEEAK
jgi:membrane-associated phospholipid phosphatase